MFSILTQDDLYRKAPSVFTNQPAGNTSSNYTHISTHDVVLALMEKGFMPTWATQSASRKEEKKFFTKHMVRFCHVDAKPTLMGSVFPELVLVNSHDGLSSYRLMAGLYRLICSNGLVAGHAYDEVRIRHQGDVVGQVIEGTYEIINTAQRMVDVSNKMSNVILTETEKQAFAQEAHQLRFDDEEDRTQFLIEKLLRVKRFEERKNDLFTVFNVIQENVLRGGIGFYKRRPNGGWMRTRTRAITSIDKGISLNQALWDLAEAKIA